MSARPNAIFSSWSPRIALFAGALICLVILMHRLLGMPTPLALNLFAVAFGLSAIAILLGVVALFDVWRRGVPGFSWALIGIFVAAGAFAWPLAYLQSFLDLPQLNDVTTDAKSPPPFRVLARYRTGTANSVTYPSSKFAGLQAAAYPDIRPLIVDRAPEEAYEVAQETLRRLKLEIVSETPPQNGAPGLIEAIDRTMVIGFYDDVAVRVSAMPNDRARVDVRSASRYGAHDLGRNATRARRLLTELQTRIDASVPARARRISRAKARIEKARSELKRRKSGSRNSADRRKPRASSQ